MEEYYCFPLIRLHSTCKETDNFFKDVMADENFEVIGCDEYEVRFKTSKGTYETWVANANYACLQYVYGIMGTQFQLCSGMPSRWTVNKFMRLVNDFKK